MPLQSVERIVRAQARRNGCRLLRRLAQHLVGEDVVLLDVFVLAGLHQNLDDAFRRQHRVELQLVDVGRAGAFLAVIAFLGSEQGAHGLDLVEVDGAGAKLGRVDADCDAHLPAFARRHDAGQAKTLQRRSGLVARCDRLIDGEPRPDLQRLGQWGGCIGDLARDGIANRLCGQAVRLHRLLCRLASPAQRFGVELHAHVADGFLKGLGRCDLRLAAKLACGRQFDLTAWPDDAWLQDGWGAILCRAGGFGGRRNRAGGWRFLHWRARGGGGRFRQGSVVRIHDADVVGRCGGHAEACVHHRF